MRFGIYKDTWYCRWDGKTYKPLKETDRDGFCCPACKQAHHRAYKLYIDWITGARRKRTKQKLRQKKTGRKKKTGVRRIGNAKRKKKAG